MTRSPILLFFLFFKLPTLTYWKNNVDRIDNHGRVNDAEQVANIIDQAIAKRTYKAASDVYHGNYTGKFHRVSWYV